MVALRRPASSVVPLGIIGVLLSELLVFAWLAPKGVVFAALAVDAVLLGSLGVWWSARRAGGFAALGIGWSRILKAVLLVTLVAALASRAAGVSVEGPLLALVVAAELGLLATALWAVVRGVRSARRGNVLDEVRGTLSRVLPRPAVEAAVGELQLGLAALRSITRRPVAAPDGFTAMRSSQSGFIVPTAILLTLIEMPALHALLAIRDVGTAAHAALLFLNVYGILWLVGDRRLMQERAHRLDSAGLTLALGARFRGVVPYTALERVIRLEPGKTPTPALELTRKVSPYDAPNVHLCFSEPVVLSTYFGIRIRARHVDLFVDEPDRFVDQLCKVWRSAAPPPD